MVQEERGNTALLTCMRFTLYLCFVALVREEAILLSSGHIGGATLNGKR